MNAVTLTECRALDLVEIIDFKWLMAGVGRKVHVERMQSDPEYARQCLVCGAASTQEALRRCAARLARRQGITLPDTPPAQG